MHFPPGEFWNGVAPEILIECARHLRDLDEISMDDFCRSIGAPIGESLPILSCMVRDGFIDAIPSSSTFAPTKKLRQLALAHVSPGLSRTEANLLVDKIIAAAERVNRSPEKYEVRVQRVAIFGSYLGEKSQLGDLDVAVQLGRVSSITMAPRQGVLAALARHSSAESKVYSALRLRKPKLVSIHTFEELKHLETPYVTVFEDGSAT